MSYFYFRQVDSSSKSRKNERLIDLTTRSHSLLLLASREFVPVNVSSTVVLNLFVLNKFAEI